MNGSGKEFNEVFLLEYIYALLPENVIYFILGGNHRRKGKLYKEAQKKLIHLQM